MGWWACTVTARNLRVLDPSAVVWDEVVAFWLVLWLVMPAGLWGQIAAFALFRFFDAVKPGPVGWADQLFHDVNPATDRHAWRKAGFGIMFDDLVAAACALLVIAGWRFFA
jgi:phosphatidylglycerophosphatase A